MKRVKCPSCDRWFVRDARALMENRFCAKCIDDRVAKSGGKVYRETPRMVEVKPSYSILVERNHR